MRSGLAHPTTTAKVAQEQRAQPVDLFMCIAKMVTLFGQRAHWEDMADSKLNQQAKLALKPVLQPQQDREANLKPNPLGNV